MAKSAPPPIPYANGVQEGGIPGSPYAGAQNIRLHLRGNHERLGEVVPRRFPVVLAGDKQPPITQGSGRLELARWIASPSNPLTTRVIVNLAFYINLRNIAGIAATVLCLYTLLFWLMMTLYHLPLLVAQEAGIFDEDGKPARRGTFAVLRRACYMAFGTPFLTLRLNLTLLLVTALLALTGVAAALFWAGGLPLLITYPTRALLIRYGVLPAPVVKEVVPDEKFRMG
jgi:hypothetical protein